MINMKNMELNILCIGESGAGKSSFLSHYTRQKSQNINYQIYIKEVNSILIYFHQLSEQEELYLQYQYDGIIFFLDLLNFWRVQENLLRWLDIYSIHTKLNIFKIPIMVLIMKDQPNSSIKLSLQNHLRKELEELLENDQIMFSSDYEAVEMNLPQYYNNLIEGSAKGLKCTNYTLWKVNGANQLFKSLSTNIKLTFLRLYEIYRHYKNDGKTKNM